MKQGMETADLDHNALAAELLAAFDARQPVEPFPNLDLATAYKITEDIRKLREMRGERVLGRKIGFTNETIWDEYGVYAPIWGYMYDTSVQALDGKPFDLSPFMEPRIEPEICFGLARAPQPDMDDAAREPCLLGAGRECVNEKNRFARPHIVVGEWRAIETLDFPHACIAPLLRRFVRFLSSTQSASE